MTIRKRIEQELVQHGLWPKEAEAVMGELEAHKSSESMQRRWSDEESGYPPELIAVLLASAKTQAVEWIDRNKPMHFARGNLDA